MSFLFGRKSGKTPSEVVKATKETLNQLTQGNEKTSAKAVEELSKHVQVMKFMLYGNAENEPSADACQQLAVEIFQNDIIPKFIHNLEKFEFEARKDVASIINNLLRRTNGADSSMAADYIAQNPEILHVLVNDYENPAIALNCGSILRECIKHENLAQLILHSDDVYKFFEFVEVSNFDTASDAFATFKDLLTQHSQISAAFLDQNYNTVFKSYTELLNSKNYVTRRLSLKLLAELLLDRAHFNIMTKYIRDPANLKLMMMLLRDKSKSIQFEAFHVFKVFVANPDKPKPILDILIKNQPKLIGFLNNFQQDREDEQFKEEKAYLVKQIEQLSE